MNRQEPAAPADSTQPADAGDLDPRVAAAVGQLLLALEAVAQEQGPPAAIEYAARSHIVLARAIKHLAGHTAQSVTSALRMVHTDGQQRPA